MLVVGSIQEIKKQENLKHLKFLAESPYAILHYAMIVFRELEKRRGTYNDLRYRRKTRMCVNDLCNRNSNDRMCECVGMGVQRLNRGHLKPSASQYAGTTKTSRCDRCGKDMSTYNRILQDAHEIECKNQKRLFE